MKKSNTQNLIIAFTTLLSLSACGGGSEESNQRTAPEAVTFSGNETESTISTSTVQPLAIASAEGTIQIIRLVNIPLEIVGFGIPNFDTSNILDTITDAFTDLTEFLSDVDLESLGSDGIEVSCDSGTATTENSGLNGSIVYNECSTGGVTLTGSLSYSISTLNQTYTMAYEDVSVITEDGETLSFADLSMQCTVSGCTYASDFTGFTGQIYRLENAYTYGTNSSGYTASGRIYDANLGYVDFDATNFTYCDNGYPSSGNITFSSDNDTGTMTIDSCTSYTVTYGGNSEPYTW